MPGLIEALLNDAEVDSDIGKGVLETFVLLCDANDPKDRELGVKHTDYFLANPVAVHKIFDLLSSNYSAHSFYTTYTALQLLSILFTNRKPVVQRYFISAPEGAGTNGLLLCLNDKREMIRNGVFSPSISLV